MATSRGKPAPSENWSVVSSYLDAGEKVAANLTTNVQAFVKDEAILELAINAVLGKVEKSYFESLTTFGKMVA